VIRRDQERVRRTDPSHAVRTHRQTGEQERAKRLAELGFDALSVRPTFSREQTTLNISSVSVSRRWTFNAYDGRYHYVEAERGETFVIARASVTSRDKGPALYGVGIYVAEGLNLTKLTEMEYRFVR
jgi:hypothetical protein